MHRTTRVALALTAFALFFGASISAARAGNQASSPVGFWKMIDDKTKKPSSIVYVFERNKKMFAKVVKLLNLKPGESPNPLCTKCKGKRKNKPVIGMEFMWGMKKEGKVTWGGGTILDPDEGKTYGCKMWLANKGKELKVRGYVFIFFRTQTWYRTRRPKVAQASKARKAPKKR